MGLLRSQTRATNQELRLDLDAAQSQLNEVPVLHYRRDDFIGSSGESVFTVTSQPYENAVQIYYNQSILLIEGVDYTVSWPDFTLTTPTDGKPMVFIYWSESVPGATTIA